MIRRSLGTKLKALADRYPVVTVTGPRQSGKTTLCRACFPDYAYVNLEAPDVRRFAQDDPKGFLAQHSGGVILDEIQRTPDLPSYLQVLVDERPDPGRFILTGSHQFELMNSINQSLAGRTAIVRLLPLSLDELFSQGRIPDSTDFHELIHKGFYPAIHDRGLPPSEALAFYATTYIERDVRQLTQIRDLSAFSRFLMLCAGNVGQLVNFTRLANDVGIDHKTASHWLSVLEASYIVFLLQPHHQNFRKRLTKSPKLYFHDVGLAAYFLGIRDPSQIESHPLRGPLFENLVISDFLKKRFNAVEDSNLYFFRDHVGNEVDLVLDYGLELKAVEIKSGKTVAPDYIKGLDFYAKIGAPLGAGRLVVYGGDEDQLRSDTEIRSYRSIPSLSV